MSTDNYSHPKETQNNVNEKIWENSDKLGTKQPAKNTTRNFLILVSLSVYK